MPHIVKSHVDSASKWLGVYVSRTNINSFSGRCAYVIGELG